MNPFLGLISDGHIHASGATRLVAPESRSMALTSVGMGMYGPMPVMSGIAVDPTTAMTFTAYFCGVNNLSTDVASLPLEVSQYQPTGGRLALPSDPRYDLVCCEPNDDTTSIRFRTALMGHVLNWGNGYAEIERLGDGTPVALHLLSPRSSDTKPIRTRNGQLVYTTEGGRGPTLPAEDVLHIAGLGNDGLIGYSVVAFGRQAIGLGLAAEANGAAFFGNGSMPRGALKTPQKMNNDAIARLRENWSQVHGGVANSHRVAVLEQGMEWQSISMSPEDAQALATREFQVLEMCRILNLPPHKLGDYSQSHLANLEESNLDYLTTTLRPWLVAIEQEMNRKLFSREERRRGLHVRHDMTALLRGNTGARTIRNQAMRNGGALSADEWRMDEGMNPLPDGSGGEQVVMQGQYVPLQDVGKAMQLAISASADQAKPKLQRSRRNGRLHDDSNL